MLVDSPSLTLLGFILTAVVHKRSEAEWDVEELTWGHHHHNGTHHGQRDLALESRNLKGNCQAVVGCVKSLGGAAILTGYNTWVTLAEYAAGGTVGKDLMTFLNQPFVANAAGVAIAGTISGQINAATSTECSTSSSEADVITAAIAAAVAAKPDATEVAVTINGPSGSWTITVAAGGENTAPAATC